MQGLRSALAASAAMVLAATAFAGDTRVLTAHLDGGNIVGAVGDPDAFGVATIVLATPGVICYSLVAQNMNAATGAAIVVGLPGGAGAVAQVLPVPAAVPTRFGNCIAAAPALVTAIRSTPGNYSIVLRTAAQPAGAVRGHLKFE